MGAAICGCVALIAILAAIRETRRLKHRPTSSADQNALDRGLELLIKDISRHRDAPMVAPRPGPTLRPMARPPRGTPPDAVLVATRLRAMPVDAPPAPAAPAIRTAPMPAVSTTLPPNLFDLFDDDDDDAPTTLASAYVESPSPATPVRVARR